MMKVFNNSDTTFLLMADDGTQMRVPHKAFCEIADKFQGDITFRMAMSAQALTAFETPKQGDAAEKTARSKAKTKQQNAEGDADKGDADKGDDAK